MASYEATVALIERAELVEEYPEALAIALSAIHAAAPYLYGVELADMVGRVTEYHRARDARRADYAQQVADSETRRRTAAAKLVAGRHGWSL